MISDVQPYQSGPIYLTEQRPTDKPKSGYETSEKGVPQRPLSSIAFGDVRGQRVHLQNALIVPAAIRELFRFPQSNFGHQELMFLTVYERILL